MTTIEHVAIFAGDTVALKDWYCKNFDMKVAYESKATPPVFFVKDADGVCIEIIPRREPSPTIDTGLVFHLAFKTDDFDKTMKKLKANGVPLEVEVSPFSGTRVIFFNDPEGNRCQIVWREKPV
jgi:glyoxylase I family protein